MAIPRYMLRSRRDGPDTPELSESEMEPRPEKDAAVLREPDLPEKVRSEDTGFPEKAKSGEADPSVRDTREESEDASIGKGGDLEEGVGLATQQIPVHEMNKENIPIRVLTERTIEPLGDEVAWKKVLPRDSARGRTPARGRGRTPARGRGGHSRQQRLLNTKNRFDGLEDESSSEFADAVEETPAEAGPSKGKGADPGNWGGLNLDEGETNVEAQAAELQKYKAVSKVPKPKKEKKVRYASPASEISRTEVVAKARKGSSITKLAASTRPVKQIPKDSYLGAAFEQAKKGKEKRTSTPSTDSNSDSSDTSSENGDEDPDAPDDEEDPSDSSSSSSESSSDDESTNAQRRRKKSKKSKKKKKSRSKTKFKAIAPKEYNGKENSKAFHRFMKEGMNYLEDAKVKPKRHVYVLSHYITGRAYDFYTQKVAQTEEKWTVDRFFSEMFNYCFPSNYCMKMRAKLEKLTQQHNQTVIEYVYELEELFNLIGGISERDRVIKLWTGFRHYIQQALWRDGLHLEVSEWDDVVAQAETIEIAQNVSTSYAGPSESKRNRFGNHKPKSTFGSGSSVDAKPRGFNGQRSKFRSFDRDRTPHKEGPTSQGNDKVSGPSQKANPRPDFRGKRPTPPGIDRNKQKAEGRCFNCNEVGHFTRNCPRNNKVKTGGTGPPGMTSFSAAIELDGDILDVPVEVLPCWKVYRWG